MSIIVIDNGASKIKYGTIGQERPSYMMNCVAKVHKQMQVLVGDQIESSLNGSLLHYQRPHERGYLTNWGCEMDVWNRLFSSSFMNINPSETSLVLTEAPVNPVALQNDCNEVIFEEYGFKNYSRRTGMWYSSYEFAANPPPGTTHANCCTIVDSGFSFTQIMPVLSGKCKLSAVGVIVLYTYY